MVSGDVSSQLWEGRALLRDALKSPFHLFILFSPIEALFSTHTHTNTHTPSLHPSLCWYDTGKKKKKAGPCSQPRRPHWMRLNWAVINLGCPIIPLYHFNGCYLPSSEGLSCWSRPRMRRGRGRGGGGYGWWCCWWWRWWWWEGFKLNPDRGK